MIIKRLELKNFRNHRNTLVELSPACNIFIGGNAQGKTNLLEAVYLTCVGRGWRTARDKEMINFDSDTATVRTIVEKEFGECSTEIILNSSQKKTIKLNNIPIAKMGEMMGQVNCVFFSPDELRLVKDAPSDRRRFLDIDISQIDKNYFYALLRYNKILLQRNTLLKSHTEDIESGLEVWDAQLSKAGAFVITRRIEFIQKLTPEVIRLHSHLTDGKEIINISYISILPNDHEEALAEDTNIEEHLLKKLRDARAKDIRLKTTSVGPHRDDIKILIDNKDVRHFASQGQQRTVALSLKLAELTIFKEITGETPILLLDDVLSELDIKRQAHLMTALEGCQSIITSTGIETPPSGNVFTIKDGHIESTAHIS